MAPSTWLLNFLVFLGTFLLVESDVDRYDVLVYGANAAGVR